MQDEISALRCLLNELLRDLSLRFHLEYGLGLENKCISIVHDVDESGESIVTLVLSLQYLYTT